MNRFRHQPYRSDRPASPYRLLRSGSPCDPSSPEFGSRLAACGRTFAEAGVAAVYLVHGTFVGNDALGLFTELSRWAPRLVESLRRVCKATFDAVVGETGNYTARFAERMEEGLSSGAGRTIPVRRFDWSSQNNHIARADGAVRLIAELARFAEQLPAAQVTAPAPRVLVWGHSHGGNVFAIATNLLAGLAEDRREFFHAAATMYQGWFGGRVDVPEWPAVESLLCDPGHPLRRLKIDWVTFGAPIRYGWEPAACEKLLHVTNHAPVIQGADWRAPYPPRLLKALFAPEGDVIQQIGVAGTNISPWPMALRTFLANRRLGRLLERNLNREWLRTRLKRGVRVANEGVTLLVDYDDPEWIPVRTLLGHACYTRSRWLPWHCEQAAEEFYTMKPSNSLDAVH